LTYQKLETRRKEPIYIFWHTFLIQGCEDKFIQIIKRQLFVLNSSTIINNVQEINITTSPLGLSFIKESIINLGLNHFLPKFKFFLIKDNYHEGVTLSKIKEISDQKISQNEKGLVLYFHTKGSSPHPYFQQDPIDSWTRMMEFFCISSWQKCIKILEKYFTCGCEMWSLGSNNDLNQINILSTKIKREFWHYSGNFWWARMDYIANYLNHPSFFFSENFQTDRKLSEYWILSSIGLKTTKLDHYPLHFTGQKYKRGIVHHYFDLYPFRYYSSGGQKPTPKLKKILFSGEVGQPYIFISKVRNALNLNILRFFSKKILLIFLKKLNFF
tara:strand:- start:97 stop:1080 length:984 start_codon:yes stop_codon:yes gene_type:complete